MKETSLLAFYLSLSKEFDLLYLLIDNPNKVFSREELLEKVWKYEHFGDLRTVDVHVRKLREKIGDVLSKVYPL